MSVTKDSSSHPALVTPSGSLTYAELAAGARRTARRLAALGVRRGDRVATVLPPGAAFAELLHAAPLAGTAIVPLNTRLTGAERRRLLEDSGARLLVDEPLEGDEAELGESAGPDDPHTVLYTSGTGGRPKPVVLTRRNHEASAIASAWNLGVSPDDRWLCVLPLFHVGGLAILMRSALYGTTAVLHDGFDEEAACRSLESGEATLVSLVPTMLRRLADVGLERAPALRAALLGGGPVPRDLLEWSAARGLPVVQTYGMTETASQIATLAVGEALEKSGSAGRPLAGVELRIERGEILVRGPMVAPGALSADGWLRTGDHGRLDADGFLWVEGRMKDVIVTGGENVMAPEVEDVLLHHPAVRDAAVAGVPDREWGERVVAWVVSEAAPAELLEHCRDALAGYKCPKEVVRVAEIPRSASGKVLRTRLPRP
jgi:o-succinylbenzoate---CoA ligase